jgi:hypothetical protein
VAALSILAAQPVDVVSDFGASMFILLVVIAGSVAAGIFLAGPLRRRRDSRRWPAGQAGPWSTDAADNVDRPAEADPSSPATAATPWSTATDDDDRLQRTR